MPVIFPWKLLRVLTRYSKPASPIRRLQRFQVLSNIRTVRQFSAEPREKDRYSGKVRLEEKIKRTSHFIHKCYRPHAYCKTNRSPLSPRGIPPPTHTRIGFPTLMAFLYACLRPPTLFMWGGGETGTQVTSIKPVVLKKISPRRSLFPRNVP